MFNVINNKNIGTNIFIFPQLMKIQKFQKFPQSIYFKITKWTLLNIFILI